jgi:hypothetical protein
VGLRLRKEGDWLSGLCSQLRSDFRASRVAYKADFLQAVEATSAGEYWAIADRILQQQRAIPVQVVQQPTEAEILRPYSNQKVGLSAGHAAVIVGLYSRRKRPRSTGQYIS